MEHQYTNALIHATSPYLLGHAHNPVDWYPWDEALTLRAKKENKLLLVSIGYSACHWCHVMEKESFEDAGVAEAMNRHFICVKVDREERPDVDHYFMTAVQLMGKPGGWPLHVIALPDGCPIWGATYLPKDDWLRSISTVASFFRKNKAKTEAYAAEVKRVIRQVSLSAGAREAPLVLASQPLLKRGVARWKERFDTTNGGNRGAPKFPLPGNLLFLLSYGIQENDGEVLDHTEKTLEHMARGGIYDQIGGGFARYSTDEKWKVPHFEKMLYDNGQLLSIYSRAFQYFRKTTFKTVVEGTVDFLERELRDSSGAFYSSLDADSEGVEGNYYVWRVDELKMILGRDYPLFARYFGVLSEGFWERGKNILVRPQTDGRFAAENGLSEDDLQEKVNGWKKRLFMERSRRVPPALDDKSLTSWNALTIRGLADAYKAFGNARYKRLAVETGLFLKKNVQLSDGKLFHSWKNGVSSIDGFLEDYAFVIQAFNALFEISGDADWLGDASLVTDYAFRHFFNEKDSLFYFSEKGQEQETIANHYQNEDTVMPAANSVMANNLYYSGLIKGDAGYLALARKMVHSVTPLFPKSPMAFSNWGVLMLQLSGPSYEVALCGPQAGEKFMEMQKDFYPNVFFAFSEKDCDLPLFKDRFISGKTLIYICRDGSCRLPVESAVEARKMVFPGENS